MGGSRGAAAPPWRAFPWVEREYRDIFKGRDGLCRLVRGCSLREGAHPFPGLLGDRSSASRAFGGCLGTERRRRTWQAAKSSGEWSAHGDPEISEWGNPAREGHRRLKR